MRRKKKKAPRAKRPKAKPPKAKSPKARAKRPGKKLVKLKRTSARKVRRAAPKRAPKRVASHQPRLKLVRRQLGPEEEMKINSLIARVYKRAAEEMRRSEDATEEARHNVYSAAAQELAEMAKKFEG